MITTLNTLPKGQVELNIELSVEELKPFLIKASQNISQATKIPGFRPGTAPYDVVKVNVGEMTIYQEAGHLAIRKTLFDTIKEKNLNIVGEPQIDILKLAPDNNFSYKATINILPEVKIGDFSKIKIKKEEVKITDEEIEKVLKNFQDIFAKETLADKQAQNGDRVEIDFQVSLDNVVVDGGSAKKYSLIIGQKQMVPGFEEQLVGLKKDEEKTFRLKFPGDYTNRHLAGKNTDITVKVINVYQRDLPAIDDALAEKLGGVKTLAELKEKIKEDLLHDKNSKNNRKLEQEMLEKIISISQFGEIPEILINSETEKMVMEYKEGVEANGLNFDQYLQGLKKTAAELKNDFTNQAQNRIKASLLTQTLALEKKIEISDEETDKEIEHLNNHHQLTDEQKKQINTVEYKHYLTNVLKQQKIIDWLKKEIIY